MKICRFGDNRLGIVDVRTGTVADVTSALRLLPAQRYPFPRYDLLIANLPKIKAEAKRLLPRAKKYPLSKVKMLPPIANPGKIVGAPVNYADHLDEATKDPGLAHGRDMSKAEIGKWGMFLKAGTALVSHDQGVKLRRPFTEIENRNDHEIELVVVIGKKANMVSRADSMKYVAGYCIGLDMTLRGPQFPDFRKSIDTYAVLGPWMVTADEFGSPADVNLRLSVNGELRQNASTKYLVYDVPRLIEFTTSFYTLMPGDIIYTGTPAGVGPVKDGDTIEAEIAGIGAMRVRVSNA